MKYALLNNEKIEPQTGIKDAICPRCGEIVIPKCGEIKIHHWAHKSKAKSKEHCDPWWENETEWHRQWKDNFPKECQEVIHYDETTGEKHVADVKTQTGIVLEFQHSSISPEEQYSREQFYKNMIWVVDAKKYYNKFIENIKHLNHIEKDKAYFYLEDEYKKCFPKKWINSKVPVIFDFGIYDMVDNEDNKQKKWLWCIFPGTYINQYISNNILCGLCLKKNKFIERVSNYKTFYSNIVISELEQLKLQYEKEKLEQEKQLEEELRKKEEQYKQEQKEFYKNKYAKEEVWRKAISSLKINIDNNNLKPIELYVSKNGDIHNSDKNDKNRYNGKKCMALGIKPSISKYNGKKLLSQDILLLIQDSNKIISAKINIPKSIYNGPWKNNLDLLSTNYNYYIQTLNVIGQSGTCLIIFDNFYEICLHQKLKNDLKYIEKEFLHSL